MKNVTSGGTARERRSRGLEKVPAFREFATSAFSENSAHWQDEFTHYNGNRSHVDAVTTDREFRTALVFGGRMMSQTNRREFVEGFSGTAPLFPLPSVVTFPHVLTPLHIFEPRYRQMTNDALESDKIIAMAMIEPGQHAGAHPPIRPIVCLGSIVAHDRMADGRFNLILQGLARARVIEERSTSLPYRVGQLELCGDVVPSDDEFDAGDSLGNVMELFRRLDDSLDLSELMQTPTHAAAPLSMVCDVLTAALQPPAPIAQSVLEELDVRRRCRLVEQLLQNAIIAANRRKHRIVPPPFSDN